VADTFDAMVSDRPYSKGRAPSVAMGELSRLAGATLDRQVVEALGRALAELGIEDEGEENPTQVAR
jgi:HD-GYP domain-containing protein (c-di-GMP phosphodiesterase class II)